jgi:K+-sensing histidine kinase KdpD
VLVGKALRYLPQGSQVTSGGLIKGHGPTTAGPEITIEVQDDGPGIPLATPRLVFSVGPDQPGVGLRLSMILDVVAADAGQINVPSDTAAFRRGTTTRLTLPAW